MRNRGLKFRSRRADIGMLATLQRAHGERARGKRAERARLIAQLLHAKYPQIPRVAVLEILLGLSEQRRNRPDSGLKFALRLTRERKTIGIKLDLRKDDRPFS